MEDLPASAELSEGSLLNQKYRLEAKLGEGGMGVVFRAQNLALGEPVAIKVLSRTASSTTQSRLLTEARAAARLRSDHVVRVFDFGETDSGAPYIAMELLRGQSLGQELRKRNRMSVSQIALWVQQTLEALGEAHEAGIVHRDVKPENLFVEDRPDGGRRIKLLDFGAARLSDDQRLTITSEAIGTPIYMAPEQMAGMNNVDGRTDLWSVGCVMYEALTGKTPFTGGSLIEIAFKLSTGFYEPLEVSRPDLPRDLREIVARCLQPDRTKRFPSARSLSTALSPFVEPTAEGVGALALAQTLNEDVGAITPAARTVPPRATTPVGVRIPTWLSVLLPVAVLAGCLLWLVEPVAPVAGVQAVKRRIRPLEPVAPLLPADEPQPREDPEVESPGISPEQTLPRDSPPLLKKAPARAEERRPAARRERGSIAPAPARQSGSWRPNGVTPAKSQSSSPRERGKKLASKPKSTPAARREGLGTASPDKRVRGLAPKGPYPKPLPIDRGAPW